jgi:hypothetical protein
MPLTQIHHKLNPTTVVSLLLSPTFDTFDVRFPSNWAVSRVLKQPMEAWGFPKVNLELLT